MVGKRCVPSILGITSRHMATDAVAFRVRMCGWKFLRMTREAFGSKVCYWIHWLVVRIVARTTPQLSITLACADASSKLLYMANNFELHSLCALRQHIMVSREYILESLARAEITELSSWI